MAQSPNRRTVLIHRQICSRHTQRTGSGGRATDEKDGVSSICESRDWGIGHLAHGFMC